MDRLHATLETRLPSFLSLCSDQGLCALLHIRLDRATNAAIIVAALTIALWTAVLLACQRGSLLLSQRTFFLLAAGLSAGLWFGLSILSLEPPPRADYELGAHRLGPRVVLSPELTSAAPTRWVVLTATHHAVRLFTCAITAYHWSRFLHYRPYVVLVGPNSSFDPETVAALRRLTFAVGGRFEIIDFGSKHADGVCPHLLPSSGRGRRRRRKGVRLLKQISTTHGRRSIMMANGGGDCLSWRYLAQTLRVFAPALPGIAETDEIVTADADRLPLVTKPFHVAPRPGAKFVRLSHYAPGIGAEGNCSIRPGQPCMRGFLFDMCYVRGTAKAWREAVFGELPLSWARMLDVMGRYHLGCRQGLASCGGGARYTKEACARWFGDQMLLTALLMRWNGQKADGGGIDTLYVQRRDVAELPGWWSASQTYDAHRRAVAPSVLMMIRERRAFELHKLSFNESEPPSSASNVACTLQVLEAAHGGRGDGGEWPRVLVDFVAAAQCDGEPQCYESRAAECGL